MATLASWRLTALEVRFPIFHERRHALRQVRRPRATRKRLHLRLQLRREVAAVTRIDQRLGLREGTRRARRQPRGEFRR